MFRKIVLPFLAVHCSRIGNYTNLTGSWVDIEFLNRLASAFSVWVESDLLLRMFFLLKFYLLLRLLSLARSNLWVRSQSRS